ncbi:MAG: nicotinate-nucleotide--dimethylbenzimidazole phosphoribosyltransferase [Deltaproteobacteria bacterium]|nr:nicotinate-nucleotide--dimethylbenzimidazole phosphoribosyltransferase [Deltaproteobacteria bacterium]
MSLLKKTIDGITPVDVSLFSKAQAHLNNLTKPLSSLGRLEEFARRYVAITGNLQPVLRKKTIFTFAGDHGVADEGVSAFPKEVTAQMVLNFLRGGAGINVLARHSGAEVVVVDIGVAHDFGDAPGLAHRKVVRGTANIRKGPAMTRDEAVRCLETGITLAKEYATEGAIFGTGEMGIANTTPSAAIITALTGSSPVDMTGRGTGIDDNALANKITVIEDAIRVNRPDIKDPVDVLAKLGGAEIGGIAGLILGAASSRIPVVVDGFISTAGAVIASELAPCVKDYIFASHLSVEKGHTAMLNRLEARPFLDLDLRLGEGTGAAMGIWLVEAGVKIYNEMATFSDAGVSEKNA